MITTVGPYLLYGEPLVAACAEAGTDYVDLTGEPEFVDQMYLEHHETALASGARIVHACGFDSIPHDLGAWFTVQQLGSSEPITLRGVVRSNATFSGGTFHSAITAMSRAKQMRDAMVARAQGRAPPRRPHVPCGVRQAAPRCRPGLLAVAAADDRPVRGRPVGGRPAVVRADFRYSHYAGLKTLRYTAGAVVAVSTLAVSAQIPPVRNFLKGRVKQGEGPSEERRDKAWFTVDFVGESAGMTVHTRVSGGDPGYTDTAKMLAESALCLALDDNPQTAGQVTTASGHGGEPAGAAAGGRHPVRGRLSLADLSRRPRPGSSDDWPLR